jgi:5-formyltetrahydrofolate cyclo-ligase
MGGGFYDRSFAYLLRHTHWLRPRLIGLAYDFQRQPKLPRQPWDVPLHAVVTDRKLYLCG